jgi:hypothetical protein
LRIGYGQLWGLAHIAGVRIVAQTTTLLFLKTLVRKDSAASHLEKVDPTQLKSAPKGGAKIVHKAQILTLMSQDVHRVSDLSKHVYTLTGPYAASFPPNSPLLMVPPDSPIQLVLGTWLLYSLLGAPHIA